MLWLNLNLPAEYILEHGEDPEDFIKVPDFE